MIFDTDDLCPGNDRLDLLHRLKEANPLFRMTAFCVQGLGTTKYWDGLPDWIECAAHGEFHPDPLEAQHWTYWKAREVLEAKPGRFVKLWKSPGWQISNGTYAALLELGWAVADQHYNDNRRPEGLPVHCLDDGDHVHTHVQDWGSNGLQESWPYLLDRVKRAESFELVSEVVVPWRVPVAA